MAQDIRWLQRFSNYCKALAKLAYVIRDREAIGEWPIIARSRRITY